MGQVLNCKMWQDMEQVLLNRVNGDGSFMKSSTGGKSTPLLQGTRRLVDRQDLFFLTDISQDDMVSHIPCASFSLLFL